jgi:hypothetical protein
MQSFIKSISTRTLICIIGVLSGVVVMKALSVYYNFDLGTLSTIKKAPSGLRPLSR